MVMKNLFLLFTALILILTGCDNIKESTDDEINFNEYFRGINGCAVFYNPENGKYTYYNKDMCYKEFSPWSTFKIVSAGAALENNIISSADDKMLYNGENYPFESWNNDLTLKEAYKESCVWYFRQLIDKTGAEIIQKTLNQLNYGNKDISQWEGTGEKKPSDLNGFWLGSSLKISPVNQIEVLKSIFTDKNCFSVKTLSVLKDIMATENPYEIDLYSKTGTGYNQAWFVGFFEQNGSIEYFAVFLDNGTGKNVAGADAKEIAINLINKHFKNH